MWTAPGVIIIIYTGLDYLNFNGCSSEQDLLKTIGKTEFWNYKNLDILRGESLTTDNLQEAHTHQKKPNNNNNNNDNNSIGPRLGTKDTCNFEGSIFSQSFVDGGGGAAVFQNLFYL